MTANEMWKAYLESSRTSVLEGTGTQNDDLQIGPSYEAWAFCGGGEEGDRLADLVLAGTKTATSSAYRLYDLEGEDVPKVGGYSVILYDDEQAACVLRTTKVSIVPFKDVGERHAWLEGEGDRSLRTGGKFIWRSLARSSLKQDLHSMKMSLSCWKSSRWYTHPLPNEVSSLNK